MQNNLTTFNTKEFAESIEIFDICETIGGQFGLHIDQVSELDSEIRGILLGQNKSSDFINHIKDRLEINEDVAQKITTEVNSKIFVALKEKMQSTTSTDVKPETISKPTHITDLEKAGGFTIEHENSTLPHETSSDGLGSDVLRVAQVRDRWSPLQQTVIPKSAEGIDQAPISMPRTFTMPAVQTPAPEPVPVSTTPAPEPIPVPIAVPVMPETVKEEPAVVKTPISITMPPAMPAIDVVPPQAQREPVKTEAEVIQKEKVDVMEIPKQKGPLADELLSILNKTKVESATIQAVPEIIKEEPVSTVPANLPIEEDTPPIKTEITSIPEPIVTAQPVVPEPEPVIVKPEPVVIPEPIIAKPEPVTIPEPVKVKEPEIVPEPTVVKPPVIVWKSEPLTPPAPQTSPEPEKVTTPEPPPIPVTSKPNAEVKKVVVPPAKQRTFDPYRESVS
jgi:predicted RNA-binding protein with RPS1 domain